MKRCKMNKLIRKIILLILVLLIMARITYSLSVETHMAMNEYIAQYSLNGFSLGTFRVRSTYLPFDRFSAIVPSWPALSA
jgi:ABC-type antimicrobial peptide transport system permease subunit